MTAFPQMKSEANENIDILFWADINPTKKGSFETYICTLMAVVASSNMTIKFVMGNQIAGCVREIFETSRVDYIEVPSEKLNSPYTALRILRRFKPRLLHLNFVGPCSPIIALARLMGIGKIVLTDHTSGAIGSLPQGNILESLRRLKRKFFVGSTDHYIAISNYIAERLHIESGVPREKTSIIFNGVDLYRFRIPRDKQETNGLKKKLFGVDGGTRVVTYVGQLIKEKGLIVYLEAVQNLIRHQANALFILVGAGPLEKFVYSQIRHLHSEKVKFLGLRDDVELILRASDLLVVPSLWEEAFGLVIAEAFASGVPVIGSRTGAIPEILLNHKTGILVRPGEVEDLSDAIRSLIVDEELRERLSISARMHAEKNFDLKTICSQTRDLYLQVLST